MISAISAPNRVLHVMVFAIYSALNISVRIICSFLFCGLCFKYWKKLECRRNDSNVLFFLDTRKNFIYFTGPSMFEVNKRAGASI